MAVSDQPEFCDRTRQEGIGLIVQQVYDRVTSDLLERGGFQLGIVTDDDFLSYFVDVLQDFLQQSKLHRHMACLQLQYGIGEYALPDWMNYGDELLVDESTVMESTESDIVGYNANWRTELGAIRAWAQDKIKMSSLRVFKAPAKDGPIVTETTGLGLKGVISSTVAGDLTVSSTAPFLGTVGTDSGSVAVMVSGPMLGTIRGMMASRGNITVIGKQSLFNSDIGLDSSIELLLETFEPYLAYGVLCKIFSNDGETKDELRREYCRARFDEGIMLAQAIMGEEMMEEAA